MPWLHSGQEDKLSRMTDPLIIDAATDQDLDRILELNQQSVSMLSPLDAQRFNRLRSLSSVLWCARQPFQVVGFLLGFEQGCDAYDSDNYRWFNQRYDNFIYIDRIVIDPAHRSAGIGRAFYQHLEQQARTMGKQRLCAEVEIDPPNPKSLAFHRLQRFEEVGQQSYGDANKRVSLMTREL